MVQTQETEQHENHKKPMMITCSTERQAMRTYFVITTSSKECQLVWRQ